MKVYTQCLTISASGKSTQEFTDLIVTGLNESGLKEGTVTIFCCHTSCSLVIMENADPSARRDLERFIDRLVPEDDPDYFNKDFKNLLGDILCDIVDQHYSRDEVFSGKQSDDRKNDIKSTNT